MNKEQEKRAFLAALRSLTDTLGDEIRTEDGQWTIKGFIDVYRSIYTISSDTQIISKVLEIHLFPKLLTLTFQIRDLHSIVSVVRDFQFFMQGKWKIASDKSGSGNTANIGSINRIDDIVAGNGMFSALGENWFDDYWMNYGAIKIKDSSGETRTIRNLADFVGYRGGDVNKIVPKAKAPRRHKEN